MAEVYTEPTPSAFGPRPTNPGTPVPLDGDGTTTLDGIAAAFSRENYVAGAASAASAASAAEPSVASSHWKPSCSKCSRISSRMRGSSSTIKIFAITNTSFSAADGFFVFLIVAYYSADMSNL